MLVDGLDKARSGITTFQEVRRALVSDMSEGGPPARLRLAMSPLVLPRVVSGQSPAITSGLDTE